MNAFASSALLSLHRKTINNIDLPYPILKLKLSTTSSRPARTSTTQQRNIIKARPHRPNLRTCATRETLFHQPDYFAPTSTSILTFINCPAIIALILFCNTTNNNDDRDNSRVCGSRFCSQAFAPFSPFRHSGSSHLLWSGDSRH